MKLKNNESMEIPNSKEKTDSINGLTFKVETINASSFKIGDTSKFEAYIGNGLCKQIKSPITLKFNSFEETLASKEIPFDSNMGIHDFMKI